MQKEHDIVSSVYHAKDHVEAADHLVRQYLPFIKSETAKYMHRIPQVGQDDELSIAMFAFHEAIVSYDKSRGAFLPFAATTIRHRLIDFSRRETRHTHNCLHWISR